MASSIFEVLTMLEKSRIHFTLERTSSDCICVYATLVGERLEIMVSKTIMSSCLAFPETKTSSEKWTSLWPF
jgi:hypothetical protein